jgi:hypothetical protein
MGQAGRNRKQRKQRKNVSQALVMARTQGRVEKQIKSGVVEGAEAETCPVCGMPSEGWFLSGHGGKREWYHFGRRFNCVERFEHMAHADDQPGTATQAEEG